MMSNSRISKSNIEVQDLQKGTVVLNLTQYSTLFLITIGSNTTIDWPICRCQKTTKPLLIC